MHNIRSKIFYSLFYPTLFVILIWGIQFYQWIAHVNLGFYGLFPRSVHGLTGIATAPLLHHDFEHLISNTPPLLVLGPIIFFFYRAIAFRIFFWIYFMTGIWVWAMAREAYHIGASGLIYGFVTFLFFSGIFRKDTRLLSLSMLVVFLYGSIAWGVFPIKPGMSWESHLMGSLAGFVASWHFRKEGPPPRVYDLGDEEEETNEKDNAPEEIIPQNDLSINYTFVPETKTNF